MRPCACCRLCVCLTGGLPVEVQVTASVRATEPDSTSRLLNAQEGRAIAHAASEQHELASGAQDRAHFVHQIYVSTGFEYQPPRSKNSSSLTWPGLGFCTSSLFECASAIQKQPLQSLIHEARSVEYHREAFAAMDFFTVPTLTFGVLYCFFVISHDRRTILHFNVTRNPNALWIIQQLREAWAYKEPHTVSPSLDGMEY
jgi:hypothetical protein